MFDWVKVDIRALQIEEIKGAALAALVFLGQNSDGEGYSATTYRNMSYWTGYNRRTLHLAVNELIEKGYLIRCSGISERGSFFACKVLAGVAVGSEKPQVPRRQPKKVGQPESVSQPGTERKTTTQEESYQADSYTPPAPPDSFNSSDPGPSSVPLDPPEERNSA